MEFLTWSPSYYKDFLPLLTPVHGSVCLGVRKAPGCQQGVALEAHLSK